MKWSIDELLAIMAKGKEAIDTNIIKNLDDPQNKDLFDVNNFSLLWGVIGITGVKGASKTSQQNIWQSIKQTDVLDAHDKGILAGFNQKLANNYEDNRLCAWVNLDNYEAGAKFNVILWDILKNNAPLAKEISPYCLDGVKLVESLARTMLLPQLETYLEQLRGQGAASGMSGTAIISTYEKEAVLRKLCNIIAKARRKLNIVEKKYLYRYLHEAYLDGFEASNIGIDDAMLARLMIEEDELVGLSELEANDLVQHNWDIALFAEELEKKEGFFEQTASKLVRIDNLHTTAMSERCLTHISNQEKPKGLLFALELVNLNQIKTAVTILIELAKKGRATEVITFLHRLLPKARGSELMIMKVLKLNLHNLHLNEVVAGNIGVKEYIARMYMNAVSVFVEMNLYKEASELLQELAQGGWFAGLPDLVEKFAKIANEIIKKAPKYAVGLCSTAKRLHLKVFNEGSEAFVGKAILPSMEIEDIVGKIEEKENYDVYHKPEVLTNKENENTEDEILKIINIEAKEDINEDIKIDVSLDDLDKEIENKSEDVEKNKTEIYPDLTILDNIKDVESVEIENVDINSKLAESTEVDNKPKITNIELPNIEKWQDDADELQDKEDEAKDSEKYISNILKITSRDIDKHFSTVKDITSKAISRASKIKKRVGEIKVASSKSVAKIRELAKNIKFTKKK